MKTTSMVLFFGNNWFDQYKWFIVEWQQIIIYTVNLKRRLKGFSERPGYVMEVRVMVEILILFVLLRACYFD